MTKEEAVKTLRELWRETNDPWYKETYSMAIETLEQELSEDCISREWILKEFQKGKEKIYKSEYFDELIWLVEHAPMTKKE